MLHCIKNFLFILSLSLHTALPPSPSSKPSLFAPHVATGAGIYTIDPGNTPTDMDSDELSGRRPLTSFIVRVVHEVTNRIAFYWLVS